MKKQIFQLILKDLLKNIFQIIIKKEEEQEDDTDSKINQLIADVVNGKYSINELYQMKERLADNKEVLEQVIETVDLKIEATENHESFSTVAANRKK